MATPTITLSINIDASGALPTPPVDIWNNLITLVAAVNPGYTILPAGMIEDLASTATYAIALLDSAAIETINSITPFAANAYLLKELGAIYGVPPQITANTSVFVVFTSDTPGVQIPPGYLVSDGTYQYQVQDGGVIETDLSSAPLFCLCTTPGSFDVAINTVTAIVSTIPPAITLTCTNPQAGTPSAGAQTQAQYASEVLKAGLVAGTAGASMAKTLLKQVPGVQPRLISIVQVNGGGWEVICGGGDPYAIANAIYYSGIDISTLVGSTIGITALTNANPGVATTNLNHGLTTGQTNVHIAGVVGTTGVNGGPYTVTVIDEKRFSFGVNTTSSGAYVSGGVVTPNSRNIVVSLADYPDTYTIPFVNPPLQVVNLQLAWNTISPNFVSDAAVSQLGTVALVNYINSIPVGVPINLFTAQTVFVNAVVALFGGDPSLISTMNWTVSINGVSTAPAVGTELIYGDPESAFGIIASAVAITQI